MFILQRYKHYILNQKKSEKKFHGIAKKMKEPGNAVPQLGIMRKKVLFHELANDDFAVDSSAEYVGAYNAPRHPPSI